MQLFAPGFSCNVDVNRYSQHNARKVHSIAKNCSRHRPDLSSLNHCWILAKESVTLVVSRSQFIHTTVLSSLGKFLHLAPISRIRFGSCIEGLQQHNPQNIRTMWPFRGKNKSDKLQAKNDAASESNGVDTKIEQKECKKDKKSSKKCNNNNKNGTDNAVSILNLSEQLNVAEEAQAQLRHGDNLHFVQTHDENIFIITANVLTHGHVNTASSVKICSE